ncbi:hypothetical protein JD969_11475 [Planctomycetota bacterium]|nr:hypothetical protein JD969_11475 [Planctomycetota bacterium]
MKKILMLPVLLLVMLFSASLVMGQEEEVEYDLRPLWEAGQETTYEFWNKRDRNISMSFNGNNQERADSYVSEGETTWVVDQVNTDGSSVCRMKVDWIALTVKGPDGEEIVIDSRKDNTGRFEALGKILKAMASGWLTLDIAANGEVTKVTGMEAMKTLVDDPEDIPSELDFKETGSDLAQLIGPPPMLAVGGSWNHEFRWTTDIGLDPIKMFINYDIDYTLTSVENIEGIPVATIDGTGPMRLEVDMEDVPAGMPPIDIRMTDSHTQTQILFDLLRHEAVGRNTTQNETFVVTVTTPNGAIVQEFQIKHQGQILRIKEGDAE